MASSNTLLTPSIIAKEALAMLENNMVMGTLVNRQYKKEFVKKGTVITIRKPNKFRATKAQARTNTNLAEPSTTFTVATQAHVSWAFSSVELTMTIEEYSERYIKPAAMTLANTVDVDLCALYKDVHNQVGTPGVTPNKFSDLGAAQQRLDEEGCPPEQRAGVLNPAANWSLADGLKGTFSPKKATDLITRGYLGTIANLSLQMDQNIQTHTTGVFTTSATPVINGATQIGASLVTNGWNATSSTVTDGDVFTTPGVFSVNPVSGASTGVLRQFVVTADTASTGSGDMTIPISPSIVTSGAYQTCSASPTNGAAVTFVGTESTGCPQNLIFHPNAFGLVAMPLQLPMGAWGSRETYNNLSIRVVKDYDIDADEEIIRLDILYGVTTLYPELACRETG